MSAKGVIKDVYKGITGRQFVPKKLIGEKCPACGQDIYVTSIYSLNESAIPWMGLAGKCCNDCHTLQLEKHHRPDNVILYPNPLIHQLTKMDYHEYLQTEYWKTISEYVKQRDGGECVLCGSRNNLHTHHKNYYHRGYEFQKDLHTLCGKCHAKFHDKQVRYE